METEVLSTRNGGQKGLHAWEPHRALLSFHLNTICLASSGLSNADDKGCVHVCSSLSPV